MREVNLETVRSVFQKILNGNITREAADRWAFAMLRAAESGNLVFVPESDSEKIWGGIQYLYGVDLLESPGKYLHTDDDIRMALESKLGER